MPSCRVFPVDRVVEGAGTISGTFSTHPMPSKLAILFTSLMVAPAVFGQVTYVDATSGVGGNTTLANGATFNPPLNGTTGADNNWEQRTALGSGGNVFESGGENAAENAPELKMTLSGLTPGARYEVFAYFWDPGSTTEDWNLRAGVSPNPGGNTIYSAADATGDFAGAVGAGLASALTHTIAPSLFLESGRNLLAAPVGTLTADSAGNISVYIDDLPAATTVNRRTWFDGLGYRTPQPLPGNGLLIAPDGAWTWFNDERAIFHQGSLLVGYVKGNGQYGITRYEPLTHQVYHMIISTGASQQQDDHNNPSITVLPDGKLLVIYSKHLGGSQFYQRTSRVALPSTNADWGPEITVATPANNTYANTYLLKGEANTIYNFHRCINFNPTVTKSVNEGASWQTPRQMIEVGTNNVRPYPRYCSNGHDRIDLIYTDGHPRDIDNSIYHMFYQKGAFRRTDGTLVDTMENLPLDHQGGQRGSVVYPYSNAAWGAGQGPDNWIPGARGWTWDVHYGADGHPVCVFQVQTGTDSTWATSRIYYYYARWTGTAWQRKFIAQGGRGIYAAESDYGGGMTIDPSRPNVIYISSNAANPFNLADVGNVPLRANARYELYRGTTEDGGLTFTWEQLTFNSDRDNLRPIVPENHGYDRALLWFNGIYSTYSNYETRVLSVLENDLKLRSWNFENNSGTLTWDSSMGRVYRITGSSDLVGFPHEAARGIGSQGPTTSHTFPFPSALRNAPRAFFRIETE